MNLFVLCILATAIAEEGPSYSPNTPFLEERPSPDDGPRPIREPRPRPQSVEEDQFNGRRNGDGGEEMEGPPRPARVFRPRPRPQFEESKEREQHPRRRELSEDELPRRGGMDGREREEMVERRQRRPMGSDGEERAAPFRGGRGGGDGGSGAADGPGSGESAEVGGAKVVGVNMQMVAGVYPEEVTPPYRTLGRFSPLSGPFEEDRSKDYPQRENRRRNEEMPIVRRRERGQGDDEDERVQRRRDSEEREERPVERGERAQRGRERDPREHRRTGPPQGFPFDQFPRFPGFDTRGGFDPRNFGRPPIEGRGENGREIDGERRRGREEEDREERRDDSREREQPVDHGEERDDERHREREYRKERPVENDVETSKDERPRGKERHESPGSSRRTFPGEKPRRLLGDGDSDESVNQSEKDNSPSKGDEHPWRLVDGEAGIRDAPKVIDRDANTTILDGLSGSLNETITETSSITPVTPFTTGQSSPHPFGTNEIQLPSEPLRTNDTISTVQMS